jgi:hypothetical protein
MNTNLCFLFWKDALLEKMIDKNFAGVHFSYQYYRKFLGK